MTEEEKLHILNIYKTNPKGWKRVLSSNKYGYLMRELEQMYPMLDNLKEMLY